MTDVYRIEVFLRDPADGRAVDIQSQIVHLGINCVTRVHIRTLYFLRGALTTAEVERITGEFLVDPIVEDYRLFPLSVPPAGEEARGHCIEVAFHPGVTDPVAKHLLHRARQLGVSALEAVVTGTQYTFEGPVAPAELRRIAEELLCNPVIQSYTLGPMQPEFVPDAAPSDAVDVIPIRNLDADALQRLSTERVLFLSLAEMQAIQAEFRALGRDPTDVELEILAQTWSEHCQHKTFKAEIDYTCHGGMPRVSADSCCGRSPDRATAGAVGDRPEHARIPSLIKTYLRAATERLNKPWVLSAFVDNAGIVAFDDEYEVSFKVETHNHPSALEPFGGANTGVGGVIRDVMGVSAQPIANTDVLCFGPLDMPDADVPGGTLHPRRIARGVVAGIEDYGNKMGIPTVSGAILYHEDYVANPLVYCGCVGIAPRGIHRTAAQPGDLCIALGGRTGRDGLHGATFSSAELTHDTGQTVGSVVQIGDPITEKAVLDALIVARDEGLYTAITDCGAGGFSSAVGEMGKDVGVEVDLRDVPLKYPGLRPWEIWLSEAQERMVIAAPEANLPRLRDICAIYNVEMTVIGRFTGDHRLRVRYGDKLAADLPMDFVHEGWPRLTLKAEWGKRQEARIGESRIMNHESRITNHLTTRLSDDLTTLLLRMLAHPDVASKEAVIRRYDHEVQGATVGKPLVGVMNDGPADAAVLKPLMTQGQRGIALGAGINPYYGLRDPYAMAWAVIDEAVRNVVAVGANPNRIAILDNFCWGSPRVPERLGELVRAAQGCHDAALAYGTPFISGKDSLNNEFVDAHGVKRAIPPTLLISALGLVPDVRRTVTSDLKRPGDRLYLVGATRDELGGSLYERLTGETGGALPAPVPDAVETFRALHQAMQAGWVAAAHDCSEGGVAVAAAEMCIGGRLGLDLTLPGDAVTALFAESNARFLVEIAPEHTMDFEWMLAGRPYVQIGAVAASATLRIAGGQGNVWIESEVMALVQAWQGTEVV
ncbi:MAG TPA: phosphoribosylformylglycinamidine synthase subunit PurL [Anaerolineae bacterium]|nr:phosphoribosylformylglycinamidine synthase subunit PurL [Anaerolineae bacterium]HQI87247.1 phosphoribosylformylglycinamidine synthase subunit PurL [Anaerolineae bacterium]